MNKTNVAIKIIDSNSITPRTTTIYPEPFADKINGREKKALGDLFGLTHFGVNLTKLLPGAMSALLHIHTKQEEFVYILQGEPTLITNQGNVKLHAGMCVGFKPNDIAHCLKNETLDEVIYLEVGDRISGDESNYPADDLMAKFENDGWKFFHKNGEPY